MISVRINAMLGGYKRKYTTTEQFYRDVSDVDKLVKMITKNKHEIKVRNKFLECIEIFELECIHNFINDYCKDSFKQDSVDLYESVILEIRGIR
jgi:hypothetical protein